MKIKRVKHTGMYDVFLGIGWDNHTRIVLAGTHVKYVSGKRLKPIQYVEISKTIKEMK